jgi:hypothetical protein
MRGGSILHRFGPFELLTTILSVRRLDLIVANELGDNPVVQAQWAQRRRLEEPRVPGRLLPNDPDRSRARSSGCDAAAGVPTCAHARRSVSTGGHADTSRPCETANLRRAASREAAPESYNRP